jgi:hypothetical protein
MNLKMKMKMMMTRKSVLTRNNTNRRPLLEWLPLSIRMHPSNTPKKEDTTTTTSKVPNHTLILVEGGENRRGGYDDGNRRGRGGRGGRGGQGKHSGE